MFWYTWPSWVVELAGGAALAACLLGAANGDVLSAAVLCALTSLLYEFALDENRGKPDHRPWADIGQRGCGSVGFLLLYTIARVAL